MVVRRDLKVYPERETVSFVLEDVFTKKECDELIELSEKRGYEPALLNIGMNLLNISRITQPFTTFQLVLIA